MTQQFIWCKTAYVSFLFKALSRRAGEMSDHTKHARQNRQRRKLCVTIKHRKKEKSSNISNYFSAFAQNGYFYLFLPFSFFFVLVFRARA